MEPDRWSAPARRVHSANDGAGRKKLTKPCSFGPDGCGRGLASETPPSSMEGADDWEPSFELLLQSGMDMVCCATLPQPSHGPRGKVVNQGNTAEEPPLTSLVRLLESLTTLPCRCGGILHAL